MSGVEDRVRNLSPTVSTTEPYLKVMEVSRPQGSRSITSYLPFLTSAILQVALLLDGMAQLIYLLILLSIFFSSFSPAWWNLWSLPVLVYWILQLCCWLCGPFGPVDEGIRSCAQLLIWISHSSLSVFSSSFWGSSMVPDLPPTTLLPPILISLPIIQSQA